MEKFAFFPVYQCSGKDTEKIMSNSCAGRLMIVVGIIFLLCLGEVGDVIMIGLGVVYFILQGNRNH